MIQFNFKRRIDVVRKKLEEESLDAFISIVVEGNNKNPYYLCGFGGTTGALVISKDRAVLSVDSRYTLRAQNEARDVEVIEAPLDRNVNDLSNYIAPALKSLHLSKDSPVGFEGDNVSVLRFDGWKNLGAVQLKPTSFLVEHIRQYKDKEEVQCLKYAGEKTSKAFEEASQKIQAGMKERDIALEFDFELRKNGATENSFPTIVASGENSASPHHETGDRVVKEGDVVVIDFGGIFSGGYCSDVTRTVFVPGKEPDPQMVAIYKTVLEANRLAREGLATGMTWKEYDKIARDFIEKEGYGEYFVHGVGHSLGLEPHDPYRYGKDAFQVGMIITDEPGIYIPGKGGVRIEDDLVITDEGVEVLTKIPYLSF